MSNMPQPNLVALGGEMYAFCSDLFPIFRSLTGDGVRQTLLAIKEHIPGLQIVEVPSGTKCFDWTIPDEWVIRDAWVEDPDGVRIVDMHESNLHVVVYSQPVDAVMELDELQKHLHSLKEQPNAIPYVTSYYAKNWGFCLTHQLRERLRPGKYRVRIDSELKSGSLTYGELRLGGSTEEQVLLSTYVCHPSMANNELSGPAVTTWLAKQLMSNANRRLSYRIVFVPETIGAIAYISKHLEELRRHIIAGYVVTCVGDNNTFSYLPSRSERTIADRAAVHVLEHLHPTFSRYSFLDRGSDERQYCSPGVDLPVASVMRSKYGTYPEYHTSLDNLDFISPEGLAGAFEVLSRCLETLEANVKYRARNPCEPQLGKHNLYPAISTKKRSSATRTLLNLLTYCDGEMGLLDIAEKINVPTWELQKYVLQLVSKKLIEPVSIERADA